MRAIYLLLLALSVFPAGCAGTSATYKRVPAAQVEAPADLVPEIMSLQQGDTVPLALYDQYPATQLARTVVFKKYLEDEKPASDEVEIAAYDYYRDSEIQLAFESKILDLIAKNGFLNTHQVKKKGGFYQEARTKAEDGFLGYHLNSPEKSAELRPKSAYFSLTAGRPEQHPLAAAQGLKVGYGDVLAVFKDHVKDRTTFTTGDSIGRQRTGVRTLRFRSREALKYEGPAGLNYFEAQVWGPLTLKDVSHFLVKCVNTHADVGSKGYPLPDELVEKMKSWGIPVFECAFVRTKAGMLVRVQAGRRL